MKQFFLVIFFIFGLFSFSRSYYKINAQDNTLLDSNLVEGLAEKIWINLEKRSNKKNRHYTQVLVDSIINYCKVYSYYEGIGTGFYYKGLYYKYVVNIEESKLNFDSAIYFFRKCRDTSYVGQVYNTLAGIYLSEGKLDKALNLNNIVIRIRKNQELNTDNVYGINKKICNKGSIYRKKGNYSLALKSYMEALNFSQKYQCNSCISEVYINLAIFYNWIKNCEKSLYYVQLIQHDTVNLPLIQKLYAKETMGSIYYKCFSDFQKAKSIYEETYNTFKKHKDQMLSYNSMIDLSRIYVEMNMLDNAEKLLQEITSFISNKEGLLLEKHQVNFLLGDIALKKENYIEAKKYYSLALKNYGSQLDFHARSDIYERLATVCEKLEEAKTALTYQKKHQLYKDSAFGENQLIQLQELEKKYESKEKQTRIELLEQENNLKSIQIENQKRQKLFIGTSSMLIIIIGYLLFIRFKSKRDFQLQKERMRFEQERLTQEKAAIESEQRLLLAQLNPHFIFNSLSSIDSYILENQPIQASEYLADFSMLMRSVLENSRKQFISLESEISLLKTYLSLERDRLENKFDFKIIVDQKINKELAIPCMFIQPFVENAINHGISSINMNGEIHLSFLSYQDGMVEVSIEDNGTGELKAHKGPKKYEPQSLNIIKDRIKIYSEKFNKNISFNIFKASNGNGTLVKLILPLG